jgi:hypothetical protein
VVSSRRVPSCWRIAGRGSSPSASRTRTGVRLGGQVRNFGRTCPSEAGHFVVEGQLSAGGGAAEDQGDDGAHATRPTCGFTAAIAEQKDRVIDAAERVAEASADQRDAQIDILIEERNFLENLKIYVYN